MKLLTLFTFHLLFYSFITKTPKTRKLEDEGLSMPEVNPSEMTGNAMALLKNPLVLGGTGYLYYANAKKREGKAMFLIQMQNQIATNNLISNKSKDIEYQNRVNNRLISLENSVLEMGTHFTSNTNILRGAIERFSQEDLPHKLRRTVLDHLDDLWEKMDDKKKDVDAGEADANKKGRKLGEWKLGKSKSKKEWRKMKKQMGINGIR